MSKFEFGNCLNCKKWAPLKDGYCPDCSKEQTIPDLPDFMKDIFGKQL